MSSMKWGHRVRICTSSIEQALMSPVKAHTPFLADGTRRGRLLSARSGRVYSIDPAIIIVLAMS
jgi:hypothetical protein